MKRRCCGAGDAVDAAGDPAIKVIFIRKAGHAQGRIIACLYRKGLALFEPRGLFIVQNGNTALISLDSAAVVVIVKAESAPAVGFHGEVAPGDAEVVAARRIHIEGSAPLQKNQAGCPCSIVEGKVVELQDRVFLEEGHRAVLEFHFRATFVRGQDIALADRQIQPSGLPHCFGVRQRVAMCLPGESDVALNETQADDAGMTGIRSGGMRTHEQRTPQNDQNGRHQFAGSHIHPLTGTQPNS